MEFFRVRNIQSIKANTAFGIFIGQIPNEIIECTRCNRKWKKTLLLDPSITLQMALSSSNFYDSIPVMYHTLISTKLKDVLTSEEIKGYSLSNNFRFIGKEQIPKKILKDLRDKGYNINDICSTPPPCSEYHRLFIKEGAKLHPKSNISLEGFCDVCGYKKFVTKGATYIDPFISFTIDISSWNGADIFTVEETGAAIYCTEKFVSIYKINKVTGFEFKRVDFL